MTLITLFKNCKKEKELIDREIELYKTEKKKMYFTPLKMVFL